MATSHSKQSLSSPHVQKVEHESKSRLRLLGVVICWFFAFYFSYVGLVQFIEQIPLSGSAFLLSGVVWMLAALDWWGGRWRRGAFWTIVGLLLASVFAMLPAMEIAAQQ